MRGPRKGRQVEEIAEGRAPRGPRGRRAGEARGPTRGCTAGARCPRGGSAGAGGSRGSAPRARRGRRPRRGPAGTRSRSRTLPGRTPPLLHPLLSSWRGKPRRSPSTAGPRGTGALWAREWAVRSKGPPPPARPRLPAAQREGACEEAQRSGNQGHRAAVRKVPVAQGGDTRGYAKRDRHQPYRRSLASSSPRGYAAWHTPGHSWRRWCTRLPDGPLAHCLLGPQNSRQRGRPGGTQQGEPSEKGQPLSQRASPALSPLASIML